jgi:U4/U6 small nuclear ribonucleoprotein PRP4
VKLTKFASLSKLLLGGKSFLATTSADRTCKIWDCTSICTRNSEEGRDNSMDIQTDAYCKDEDNKMIENGSEIKIDRGSESVTEMKSSVNKGEKSRILHTLKGHQGAVNDCDFHPSGQYIGTASSDYTWRLWDVETGKEILLQDGHVQDCTAITFQHDGSLALTADAAGVALLWDLRSGQEIHAFQGHVKKITSACFNPNGFQVATGSIDNMVRIWDLRKKKCSYCLPAHSNLISDLRYSKSGEMLMTSSFDGCVKIWGHRDYQLLRSLSGHLGKVMACDFSPRDEKHVVSVGFDRTLKLWAHKDEF